MVDAKSLEVDKNGGIVTGRGASCAATTGGICATAGSRKSLAGAASATGGRGASRMAAACSSTSNPVAGPMSRVTAQVAGNGAGCLARAEVTGTAWAVARTREGGRVATVEMGVGPVHPVMVNGNDP
jgi:hypothetical protein